VGMGIENYNVLVKNAWYKIAKHVLQIYLPATNVSTKCFCSRMCAKLIVMAAISKMEKTARNAMF
jgi:hypothetical protein